MANDCRPKSVRDCEFIRQALLGQKENPEDRKWSLLGQSYGGWCSMTYLSFHPEGLKEVFLTGGLGGLFPNPDPDYARLVRECAAHTSIYIFRPNSIYQQGYWHGIRFTTKNTPRMLNAFEIFSHTSILRTSRLPTVGASHQTDGCSLELSSE